MDKLKSITVVIAVMITLIFAACSDLSKSKAESIDTVKIVFEYEGIPYERENIPIDKQSVAYKIMLKYFDGSREIVSDGVAWSSSQTAVATIDSNGTAHLKQIGETIIHASVKIDGSPFEAQTLLNIVKNPVESLSITPGKSAKIAKGKSKKFIATVKISGFDFPIPIIAQWSPNAEGYVTISKNGITTNIETNALSQEGKVLITASYRSVEDSVIVEVTPPVLADIKITSTPADSVNVNGIITFHADGIMSDGTIQEDIEKNLSWKSSNSEILRFKLSPKYEAKGVSPGDVNITASEKTLISPVKSTVSIKVVP